MSGSEDGQDKVPVGRALSAPAGFAGLDNQSSTLSRTSSSTAVILQWKEFEVYRNDFDSLDSDSSGFLEDNEIRKLLARQMQENIEADAVAAFMAQADADRDGKVSLGEYISTIIGTSDWVVGAPLKHSRAVPLRHRRGSLTSPGKEKDILKGKLLDEIVESMDLNGDGTLNEHELQVFAYAVADCKSVVCQNIGFIVAKFAGMSTNDIKQKMVGLMDKAMVKQLHQHLLNHDVEMRSDVDVNVPVCDNCGSEQGFGETFYFCTAESHIRCAGCTPPVQSANTEWDSDLCPCACGGVFENRIRANAFTIKERCVNEICREIGQSANGFLNGTFKGILIAAVPAKLRDIRACLGHPVDDLKHVLMTLNQTEVDEVRRQVRKELAKS